MKLVMLCTTCDARGFKDDSVLPVEYRSKAMLLKDFMGLAIPYYKKFKHNFGRGSYFTFLGKRFEASDYYYIFSDKTTLTTPPHILTLEEWFNEGTS